MDISHIVRLFLGAYFAFPQNFLFWLVIILIGSQYRRIAQHEAQILGRPRHDVLRQVVYSTLFGMAGGLLASTLLIFFGISLIEIGIAYVWPLAVLMVMVHPRYLCFAYAGGLVGAFSAFLQLLGNYWPAATGGILAGIAALHIPGLLALIGILHLTESFLIAVSGHLFPSPLYLKTDKGVVGGFSLQKFWPLPLVGLWALVVPQAAAETLIGTQMPDWWPVFASRATAAEGQVLLYMLTPIVAGLGYGDLAVSSTVREKSRRSAVNLGMYSLILIGAAFLAFRAPALTLPAALFAPFGHEFLILFGNRKEFSGTPRYVAPAGGMMVMDFFAGSSAKEAGLAPGDIITAVNGNPVGDSLTFQALMRISWDYLELDVVRGGQRQSIRLAKTGDAGIIPVPDHYAPAYMEIKHAHFFTALAEKLQKLRRQRRP